MTKVLITGASGFLGINVTRELVRLGYEVRILVRPNAKLPDVSCETFYGHIDNRDDVFKAVAGCDVVVHAAAVTDQWNVPYELYERINITATKYIAEAVMAHKVQRLIFVSTAGAIEPGTEEQEASFKSNYILTKYLAQQYLLAQPGLPVIVVLPTFMIGAYDHKPSSGQLLLYGINSKLIFYPPGGKNFVHVQDVSRGIANAITKGKIGETYLLAHHNMSYKEFYQMVHRQTGRKPLLIRIPPFVLKLAGSLLHGKLNKTTARLISMHTYYSGKKSEIELSLTYSPIEDAIQEALTWFKQHNYY